MPLCTTATESPLTCGWALRSEGSPWVAQRVWARPSDPRTDAQGRGEVGLIVARWNVRGPLYIGWTANYAVYREAYDGFMEGALQSWPKHVSSAVQEAAKAFR